MTLTRNGSGDALLFVVAISVIALALIGIMLGLAMFFGEGYDFRLVESDALRYAVEQCLRENNMFSPTFKLEDCGLDSRVLGEEHVISLNQGDLHFLAGVASYRESCFLKTVEGKLGYPRCTLINGTFREKLVTGIVGSAQRARRIS